MGLARCDDYKPIERDYAKKLGHALEKWNSQDPYSNLAAKDLMHEVNKLRMDGVKPTPDHPESFTCASAQGVYDKLPERQKGDVSVKPHDPNKRTTSRNQPGGYIEFNSPY
jgi:hypothetical protein